MNAQLGRKMHAAMIALDATTRNVEVDRCAAEELEVLAHVCDELARALRAGAVQIEGAENSPVPQNPGADVENSPTDVSAGSGLVGASPLPRANQAR